MGGRRSMFSCPQAGVKSARMLREISIGIFLADPVLLITLVVRSANAPEVVLRSHVYFQVPAWSDIGFRFAGCETKARDGMAPMPFRLSACTCFWCCQLWRSNR